MRFRERLGIGPKVSAIVHQVDLLAFGVEHTTAWSLGMVEREQRKKTLTCHWDLRLGFTTLCFVRLSSGSSRRNRCLSQRLKWGSGLAVIGRMSCCHFPKSHRPSEFGKVTSRPGCSHCAHDTDGLVSCSKITSRSPRKQRSSSRQLSVPVAHAWLRAKFPGARARPRGRALGNWEDAMLTMSPAPCRTPQCGEKSLTVEAIGKCAGGMLLSRKVSCVINPTALGCVGRNLPASNRGRTFLLRRSTGLLSGAVVHNQLVGGLKQANKPATKYGNVRRTAYRTLLVCWSGGRNEICSDRIMEH
ncbi:hypothetical protein F5144DRAFT_360785 [Chaetomium tenue]|uniref:Uncharacterized protein n=1 Tax=Chaetomium tenue TaxID=1854479 RepID=A0ACB7P2A8_9PEZI|nr:hypothetical protein F5144DRAFT_360785 [Chaetomium globosum]